MATDLKWLFSGAWQSYRIECPIPCFPQNHQFSLRNSTDIFGGQSDTKNKANLQAEVGPAQLYTMSAFNGTCLWAVKASQRSPLQLQHEQLWASTHCQLKADVTPSFLFRYSLSIHTEKSEALWEGLCSAFSLQAHAKKMEKKPRASVPSNILAQGAHYHGNHGPHTSHANICTGL